MGETLANGTDYAMPLQHHSPLHRAKKVAQSERNVCWNSAFEMLQKERRKKTGCPPELRGQLQEDTPQEDTRTDETRLPAAAARYKEKLKTLKIPINRHGHCGTRTIAEMQRILATLEARYVLHVSGSGCSMVKTLSEGDPLTTAGTSMYATA